MSRKTEKNNHKMADKKMRRRFISILLAVAILINILPLGDFISEKTGSGITMPVVHAAEDSTDEDDPDYTHDANGNITVSIENFVEYSEHAVKYHKYHQYDNITINLSTGAVGVFNYGYQGLGTETYPFAGSIVLSANSADVLNLDAPLFNYVYDTVTINGGNAINISRYYDTSKGIAQTTPLIASHIVHKQGTSASWNINVTKPSHDDDAMLASFGGMIGTVGDEDSGAATITINVTMDEYTNGDVTDTGAIELKGRGDTGLICGAVTNNSTLNFTLSTAAGGTSRKITGISTDSGNIGGLAGTVESGCTFHYTGGNIYNNGALIKTESGYAGGIAGSNSGTITVTSPSAYQIKQHMEGTLGAGGLYGHYAPATSSEIYTDTFSVDCQVNGSGYDGGLFGVLEGSAAIIKSNASNTYGNTVKSNHASGSATAYGGLVGSFEADSLSVGKVNVDTSKEGSAVYYGGGIGEITQNKSVYAVFDGIKVTSANTSSLTYGGLAAKANRAFVDSKDVKISATDYKGGALVGTLAYGVLRISGTTDLSAAKCNASVGEGEEIKVGQIVGYRDDALVFEEGTLTEGVLGSSITRYTTSTITVDDIGSWGEVLIFSAENANGTTTEKMGGTGVLQINETTHAVTISAPSTSYLTIKSVADYAKTSLCFQINAGDNEWVTFSDTDYNYSTIKSENITLSADVSLSGTGLIGLTRDNDITLDASGLKCTYSAAFTGGNNKISFATGEAERAIYRHLYNGLFAITNNATISNTEFAGYIHVNAKRGIMYAGTAAGLAKGTFTSSGLTVNTAFTHAGASQLRLGGVLGEASSVIGAITISGSTVNCDITGTASHATELFIGGVIGRISHASNANVTWALSNITVTGKIENSGGVANNRIGGLIASIGSCTVASRTETNRKLNLSGISLSGLTISASKANSSDEATDSIGGALGYSWYNVCADFDRITVASSEIKLGNINSDSGKLAGLVYAGSGYWTVKDADDIKVSGLTVTASSAASFGGFVNQAWNSKDDAITSALYLELQNVKSYNILGITFGESAFTVFDEIAAYSSYPDGSGDGTAVLANGQAVISIKTAAANGLNMTGSGDYSNSYVPQTSLGNTPNNNTRYYYNLDTIRTGTLAPQLLMRWGLNTYAHSTIKAYFPNDSGFDVDTIPAGTYDMNGYSWYPVDVSSVTVNGTFKFYNKEFETKENHTFLGSDVSAYGCTAGHTYDRTSIYDETNSTATQHHLLHMGLFRNVSTKLTVRTVTLQGNVGYRKEKLNNSVVSAGSGFLVCGTVLKGTANKRTTVTVSGPLSLDGAYISGIGETTYAPLIINQADDYTRFVVSNVITTNAYNSMTASGNPGLYVAGSNAKAACSLIGKLGIASSPTAIDVTFSDMKLDARTADVSDSGYNTELDTAYGTTRTIFTQATLLYWYKYVDGSEGSYNYAWAKDWKNDTYSAVTPAGTENPNEEGWYELDDTTYALSEDTEVNSDKTYYQVATYTHSGLGVTYGKELGYATNPEGTITNEYPNKERKYSDGNYYTNPVNAADSSGAYKAKYLTDFLPYVATGYNAANLYHQIKVNHQATAFSGCGTYNDPYLITTADEYQSMVNLQNGSLTVNSSNVYLPLVSGSYTTNANSEISNILNSSWCASKAENNSHVKFTYTNETDGKFTATVDSTTYSISVDEVRKYLSGAYYMFGASIETDIDSGFGSNTTSRLPSSTLTGNPFAFHGVIIGGGYTLTLKGGAPLIQNSSGSVVKNLGIVVDNTELTDSTIGLEQTIAIDFPTCKNYGSVMSCVLGGDNIIDKVSVSYTSGSKITLSGAKAQLIPVGGYVGVIEKGGVIFRGMDDLDATDIAGLPSGVVTAGSTPGVGASLGDMTASTNKRWLYVNPIVGRVINGYAVTESTAYRPYEDGTRVYHGGAHTDDDGNENTSELVTEYWAKNKSTGVIGAVDSDTYNTTDYTLQPVTMQNGNKHYSITDISSSLDKLSYADSKVKVPNGQAWFVMSLLVNSGESAGSLGYNQNYQVSRSAAYSEVGTPKTSTACDDFDTYAKNDILNSNNKNSNKGYLYKNYYSSTVPLHNTKRTVELKENVSYYLPDGYKGMGNFFQNSDDYRMKITRLTGNGATISQNTYYYYYDVLNDYSVLDDKKRTGYVPNGNSENGLGLVNITTSDCTYQNIYLTGNVKCDLVALDGSYETSKTAKQLDIVTETNNADGTCNNYLSAGMLIGTSRGTPTVTNVALVNIYVVGIRNSGGLIGFLTNSKTITYTIESTVAQSAYNSDKIKVHGRASTGGLIGKINTGAVKVDMNNHTFNLTEVVCECKMRDGEYWDYGVGGFIGMIRKGASSADSDANIVSSPANYFKNIVIGTENREQNVKCDSADIFTAGVVGIMNKAGGISIENCVFYNLSVKAQFAAAGLVAFPTTFTKARVVNTHLYSTLNSEIVSVTDYAGGFIGSSDPRNSSTDGSQKFTFENCSVEGYTISGKRAAGGAIGFRGAYKDPSDGLETVCLVLNNIEISDCTIKSGDTTGKNKKNRNIEYGAAGGLIGEMNAPVIGYNIFMKNNSIESIAENGNVYKKGYICGRITTDSYNMDYSDKTCNETGRTPYLKIAGFSRQADTISTMESKLVGECNYNNGDYGYVIFADYNGTADGSNPKKLFSNITTSGTNVDTMRSKTTVTVKTYVGGELSKTETSVTYGDYKSPGTGTTTTYSAGYVAGVSADYTETITTIENENWPFVTNNPYFTMWSSDGTDYYLTGDGVQGLSFDASRFKKIQSEITSGNKKAYSIAPALSKTSTNESIVQRWNNIENNYRTSVKEFSNYTGGMNFPLLVVSDTNDTNLTQQLNDYLQTLTNTNYDFANLDPGIGVVNLHKCTFNTDNKTWSVNPGTKSACLKIQPKSGSTTANVFHMSATEVDNENAEGVPQFSLVDVQFYDPSDTNNTKKVAYHLYVPVYVKKVLQYNFHLSFASNTDYTKSAYSKDANTLFENLGNPVTLEFEYEYTNNADQWVTAINSGDSLLTNYYKSLLVNTQGNDWPANTRLILVDAANADKTWYMDSPNMTGSYLHLYDFTKDGSITEDREQHFKPGYLNNLMTVTINEAAEGALCKCTAQTEALAITEGATVLGSDGYYYRPYDEESDSTETRYNATAVSFTETGQFSTAGRAVERYYLTILTPVNESDTTIYHLVVRTKDSFDKSLTGKWTGDDTWRPNKINVNRTAHLFIGNLFENNLTLTVNPKLLNIQLMNAENNYLSINMNAVVSLKQAAINSQVATNMSQSRKYAEIYQTFLMTYDKVKTAGGQSELGISLDAGGMIGSGYTYYIDSGTSLGENKVSIKPPANDEDREEGFVYADRPTIDSNYIEFRNNQNLIDYLCDSTGNYAATLEVAYQLVYDTDLLSAQFPKNESEDSRIGSCVIGYSNIASSKEGGVYSKTSKPETDTFRHYTADDSNATLEYNVVQTSGLVPGPYSYLGKNAMELEDTNQKAESYVDSYAVFDTNSLRMDNDFIEYTFMLSNRITGYIKPQAGNPDPTSKGLGISAYLTDLTFYGADTLNAKDNPLFIYNKSADNQTTASISLSGNTGTLLDDDEETVLAKVTVSADGKRITIRIKKTLLGTQGDGVYLLPIDFKVKTGDAYKETIAYSNYKVSLTASTYSDMTTSDYFAPSYSYDHIIYTNTRLDSSIP